MHKVKVFTLAEQHPARLGFNGLGVPGRAHQRGSLCKENAENFTSGYPYVKKHRGFVMPSPLMIVGGVALAFGISTILFWRLYNGAINEYAEFRANVEAAQEQVRVENERKHQELMVVNARLDAGWSGARRELAARPSLIRVRPNSCPRTVPSVSAPTSQPDESSAEPALGSEGTITAEACEKIANDAVIDAAQVVWLQDYIQRTYEATK